MGQFTVCFAHQHAAADSESCLIWAAAAAAQWATRVADVEGVVRVLPACLPVRPPRDALFTWFCR